MKKTYEKAITSAVVISLASVAFSGCRPSQHERMRQYEIRELHCLQTYRIGDIQICKQALVDYLQLVGEEEASGLPFKKIAWTKALIETRLALIHRELGDARRANHYLQQAVAHAKMGAQEDGDKSWANKTEEQAETTLIKVVDALDENTKPRWRNRSTLNSK